MANHTTTRAVLANTKLLSLPNTRMHRHTRHTLSLSLTVLRLLLLELQSTSQNNSQYVWLIADFVSII